MNLFLPLTVSLLIWPVDPSLPSWSPSQPTSQSPKADLGPALSMVVASADGRLRGHQDGRRSMRGSPLPHTAPDATAGAETKGHYSTRQCVSQGCGERPARPRRGLYGVALSDFFTGRLPLSRACVCNPELAAASRKAPLEAYHIILQLGLVWRRILRPASPPLPPQRPSLSTSSSIDARLTLLYQTLV